MQIMNSLSSVESDSNLSLRGELISVFAFVEYFEQRAFRNVLGHDAEVWGGRACAHLHHNKEPEHDTYSFIFFLYPNKLIDM